MRVKLSVKLSWGGSVSGAGRLGVESRLVLGCGDRSVARKVVCFRIFCVGAKLAFSRLSRGAENGVAVHDLTPIQIAAAMRDDPPTIDPHSDAPVSNTFGNGRDGACDRVHNGVDPCPLLRL
jgi:hypothetical protein